MAIARIQFEFIWVGLVCPVEGERGIILHGNHKYSNVVYIQNFVTLMHNYPAFNKSYLYNNSLKSMSGSNSDRMDIVVLKKDVKLDVLLQLLPSQLCPES